MVYTKEVTGADGKPTVVMVQGSPFEHSPKSEHLKEQRKIIAAMIAEDQPANVLYIVSDVIREEAELSTPVYKEIYTELHNALEHTLQQLIQFKLDKFAEGIKAGTMKTEEFK